MKLTPAILERARRHRAGIIGILQACSSGVHGKNRCAFPSVLAETSTGHELECPAHSMQISQRRVQDGATESQPTTEKDPAP